MKATRTIVNGKDLIVIADIAKAWGRHENNYGFFEQSFVAYGADRVRVDVKVVTSPKHSAESVKSFPVDSTGVGDGKYSRYCLAGGTLIVKTSLEAVMSHVLPTSGKPGFFEEINIATDGHVKYWLELYIRNYESGPSRPGDKKEWDTQFWSGGLPTLGKRR
jgi:hypothetical protein